MFLDSDRTGGLVCVFETGVSRLFRQSKMAIFSCFVLTLLVLSIEAALDLALSSSQCHKSSLDVLV